MNYLEISRVITLIASVLITFGLYDQACDTAPGSKIFIFPYHNLYVTISTSS